MVVLESHALEKDIFYNMFFRKCSFFLLCIGYALHMFQDVFSLMFVVSLTLVGLCVLLLLPFCCHDVWKRTMKHMFTVANVCSMLETHSISNNIGCNVGVHVTAYCKTASRDPLNHGTRRTVC